MSRMPGHDGLYVAGAISAGGTTFLATSCCASDPNRPHRPLPPKQKETTMQRPTIVSRDEWTAARKRLLVKEKELNGQRDALSAERRKLPMVYRSSTAEGEKP